MKITQEHVGNKVFKQYFSRDSFIEILFVGQDKFFGKFTDGSEATFPNDDEWQLYTEPKKKKLMAPAIYITPFGPILLSDELFLNEEDAGKNAGSKTNTIWPARMNEHGWYEVEE